MYLSMQLIIITVIFKFDNRFRFIVLPFCILYITQFQIKPEERIIENILVKIILSTRKRLDVGCSLYVLFIINYTSILTFGTETPWNLQFCVLRFCVFRFCVFGFCPNYVMFITRKRQNLNSLKIRRIRVCNPTCLINWQPGLRPEALSQLNYRQ
jgi:hypothetical protein